MSKKLLSVLLALCLLALPLFAFADQPALEVDANIIDSDFDDEEDADIDWLYEDDDEEIDEDDDAFADIDESDYTEDISDSDEDDLLGAMEVYSWFAMEPLDVDETLPDSSGTMYRVLDERFNTKDSMLNLLRFYFSDEIVDELWSSQSNPYTEIDGFLYTSPGEGREMDERIGETEFDITKKTDNLIEIDVLAHYVEPDDGETEETFHYVRELINGEWKYTQFPFYW